jgi:uncharacterized protein YjbJ (UPF0337 family)
MKLTNLILSSVVAIVVAPTAAWWSTEAASQASQPLESFGTSPILSAMNKDQFLGKWKQFKGDLKQQWGEFTDDDLKQIEGNYDQFEGKLQERYGDRREDVKRWTDEWFKKHSDAKRK